MELKVFTWNLFHGRDGPPDRALYTRWAEWTRRTERNATHVQVNRDLWRQFTDMVCGAGWDVALLQECPPRWEPGFVRECRADSYRSLTSRNQLSAPSWWIARRWPDLIGSSEGGSNMILARGGAGRIAERRELTIRPGKPERRTMAFARLSSGLCATCLHASTSPPRAEEELLLAAERAVEWAGDAPLVFGGDFNVQAAQERGLRASSSPASASPGSPRPTPSTTSSRATSRSSRPAAPGHPSSASCARTASPSASPTTRPSS